MRWILPPQMRDSAMGWYGKTEHHFFVLAGALLHNYLVLGRVASSPPTHPTKYYFIPSIYYIFTMHGQKRSEYKSRLLHTETSLKLATKAKQWNHLNHELLTQHRRLLLLSSSVDGHGSSSIGKDDDDDDIIAKTPPPSPAILLSLTEKMLSVNPDPSHLWNIRRELLLLQPLLQTKKETKDDDDDDDDDDEEDNNVEDGKVATAITTFNIDKQLQEELKLTAHCLQRNPKSYATWHRK